MANPVVIMKNNPQLVRKNTVIKVPNVKVIVSPSKNKAVNLQDINKLGQQRVQIRQSAPSPPKAPANLAVTRIPKKQSIKTPSIKYLTREIDQDSLVKIKQIRNTGKGKILIIIGNGPSINQIDLSQFKHHPDIHTLSINKPDPRLWPTTYWAFFDVSQLRRHTDLWSGFNGIIFNSTSIKRHKPNTVLVRNLGGRGFSKDLTKGLYIGRSSVFAAMQIGLWMNYDHIYIFGCDMNPSGIDGKLHFYGTNPDVNPDTRKERFKKESEFYDYAAEILDISDRKKFTFCSSENNWSFVDKFNKLDHKMAIQYIIKQVNL